MSLVKATGINKTINIYIFVGVFLHSVAWRGVSKKKASIL
jgi:hypothetical protein